VVPHKLPEVSGQDVVKLLERFGYTIVQQRGSHIHLQKDDATGQHSITVPNHHTLAKGTLDDIVNKISLVNNIPKHDLIDLL
jgi:predicted RNA binding protein YcfA (HicA-like mRNA interferase family)